MQNTHDFTRATSQAASIQKHTTRSAALAFAAAVCALCTAFCLMLPAQAQAQTTETTDASQSAAALQAGTLSTQSVIDLVDFGESANKLFDGEEPLLTAGMLDENKALYEIYDEAWELGAPGDADYAALHSNETEQAKVTTRLNTCEEGKAYYHTIAFKAVGGNTFASDVKLSDSGNVVEGVGGELSENGTIVTFKRFHRTIAGKRSAAEKLDFSNVKLSWTSKVYNGKVQAPKVTGTVMLGDRPAVYGDEYTVRYDGSETATTKATGVYKVVIAGNNGLTGSKTLAFKITPEGTTIKSLKAGSKSFEVTWAKQKTQTSGYELQYSTSKKFKNALSPIQVGKTKVGATAILLKAKKTYYVRVRTYKGKGDNKVVSAWSATKKVKTKA